MYAWVLCKHVTKHFPYGIVFSTYILRHLSFFHPFISCLSEILKCQNTPLHTTKCQRKRRILFGMYNWKWMNLSKIRQDKNVSDKKYNLSLRLVLFCSLPRFFLIGPLQLSLSTVKRTKLYRSNVRDVFNFLQEKLHFMVFSRWISVEQLAKRGCFKLQEPWKVGILIGRIIFLKLEKTSFACGQFNKLLQVSSKSVAIVFRL